LHFILARTPPSHFPYFLADTPTASPPPFPSAPRNPETLIEPLRAREKVSRRSGYATAAAVPRIATVRENVGNAATGRLDLNLRPITLARVQRRQRKKRKAGDGRR